MSKRQYGEPTLNDNGHKLIELCETNNLKILNGFYKHKDIHRYAWTQNTRNLKTIIDYVINKREWTLRCNDVRVLGGVTCGCEHYLLRARVFFPLRKVKDSKNDSDSEQLVFEKSD